MGPPSRDPHTHILFSTMIQMVLLMRRGVGEGVGREISRA